tara:strand:+ start:1249 stop:2307 length:1059 start_codon:yes stop_codon:yes gene_type:complete
MLGDSTAFSSPRQQDVPRPARSRFVGLLWGCAEHLWSDIVEMLHATPAQYELMGMPRFCPLHQPARLEGLVRNVYAVDDVREENLQIKLRGLKQCPADVLVMNLSVTVPAWTSKSNGKTVSGTMQALKSKVRQQFRRRVAKYTHDVIIHVGDNVEAHTRHLDQVLATHLASCSPAWGVVAWRPRWASSAGPAPDIRHFLDSICHIPHTLIKLDGQPDSFPLEVKLGGDLDILADATNVRTLQNASRLFFSRRFGGPSGLVLREVSQEHSWQLRIEARRRLVYLIHVIEAFDDEHAAILGRRRRKAVGSTRDTCVWEVSAEDARRLRRLDCMKKRKWCNLVNESRLLSKGKVR